MQIKEIQIENFKKFKNPVQIKNLESGINLFIAPNETGKSTIAAAIKAVFFERYKSSALEYMRPWGGITEPPEIKIAFEHANKNYWLEKTFLNKKRCYLTINQLTKLEGDEAENHLSKIFNYQYTSRGENTAENLGVPGLLWITQGTSHEIEQPVKFAKTHLQDALGETIGELATSSADLILKNIQNQLNEYITSATKKPRKQYQETIEAIKNLQEETKQLQEEIKQYQKAVDKLENLEKEKNDPNQENTKKQIQEALNNALEKQKITKQIQAKEENLKTADAQIKIINLEIQKIQNAQNEITIRQNVLKAAQTNSEHIKQKLQTAQKEEEENKQKQQKAKQNLETKQKQIAQTQKQENKIKLKQEITELNQKINQLETQQTELQNTRAKLQNYKINKTNYQELEKNNQEINTIKAKLETISTAIEFNLEPNTTIITTNQENQQEEIQNQKTIIINSQTQIKIPKIGTITIKLGLSEIEKIKQHLKTITDKNQKQLQELNVENIAHAQKSLAEIDELKIKETALIAELKAIAPQGASTIKAAKQTKQTQLEQLEKELSTSAESPPQENDTTSQSASEEELAAAYQNAQINYNASLEKLNEARHQSAIASANLKTAGDELKAAQNQLQNTNPEEEKQKKQEEQTQKTKEKTIIEEEINHYKNQIQNTSPQIIEQDIQRLQISLDKINERKQEREKEIIQTKTELQIKGEKGQEEELAKKQQELEQNQKTQKEIEKEIKALQLLETKLIEKKEQISKRLHAPLQKHLSHYLEIIFPNSKIGLNDNLIPEIISRQDINTPEIIQNLSMGAKEQIGIISRLAYADLLKEAGKPTLLILDDALVNTDTQRLIEIKRALFDASKRHQIIIFSCHPDYWQDIGAQIRTITKQ